MDRARLLRETQSDWDFLDGPVQVTFLRRHRLRNMTAGYLDSLADEALADIHYAVRTLAGSYRATTEPSLGLVLEFFRAEPTLVRSVLIPGRDNLEDASVEVAAEMAKPGWSEMRWARVEEPTGGSWPQPSVRTLDMARDEPRLFKALRALHSRHLRLPFGFSDSD